MIPLPPYWRLIAAGLAVAALFALWCVVMGWKEDSAQLDVCRANKAIITANQLKEEKLANEYFNSLDGVNRRLASLKRLQPARCVCPQSATCSPDAASGAGRHAGSHGTTIESYRDYAADCQRLMLHGEAWVKWANETKGD